jgi:pimeloyl-ACP methyl ester carboxylesterase
VPLAGTYSVDQCFLFAGPNRIATLQVLGMPRSWVLLAFGTTLPMCCTSALAASCVMPKWHFVFEQRTSATMTVSSGAFCQTSLNSRITSGGSVIQKVIVSAPPRNGTATAQGLGVFYRSDSGFQGHDSFAFTIMGRSNTGQRSATVEVSVTVKAPEGIPLSVSGPIELLEYTPSLIQNRGPKDAVGVIYFVRGGGSLRYDDRHHAPQYFLTSLSQAGWDVIYAKYPDKLAYPGPEEAHKRVAEFLRDRVAGLKQEGYRRVILGGQSWGAWVAMVAEKHAGLAAEALFLLVPASYGTRTLSTGKPNLVFYKNASEFASLLNSIRKPVGVVFFSADDYDPGGRGKLVKEHALSNKLPYLLIDNPPGFRGHGAGWLPIFDYVFGKCIRLFLEMLISQQCELPALSNSDFRSIVSRAQIPDLEARRISTSDELAGRSYVVFTTEGETTEGEATRAFEVTYGSMLSLVRQTSQRKFEEKYNFRSGQYCDEAHCTILIRWDDTRLIGFDPKTGMATSWWVRE